VQSDAIAQIELCGVFRIPQCMLEGLNLLDTQFGAFLGHVDCASMQLWNVEDWWKSTKLLFKENVQKVLFCERPGQKHQKTSPTMGQICKNSQLCFND